MPSVFLLFTLLMHTGVTSPHWIDHTNLNDMLSRERESPESKPQNIWSISTQTFEQNRGVQQPSQSTSTVTTPLPVPSVHARTADTSTTSHGNTQNGSLVRSGTDSGVPETFSRVADDGERTTPIVASSPTAAAAGGHDSVKPSRTAPPPPKTPKKSKQQKDADYDQEPMPYVYPMQKFMQKLKRREKERDPGATAQTGGNQSHEYAQPHVHLQTQHDAVKQTSATTNSKKDKYQPIDPKLKQPKGQYQDLLVNGLPRGQSLPAISTFSTLS